jgi:hypothetical protein
VVLLSGIPSYDSNSAYFSSHAMPILSLEDPFSLAAILSSTDIAESRFSYPFLLAAILASVGIAPIPFSYAAERMWAFCDGYSVAS